MEIRILIPDEVYEKEQDSIKNVISKADKGLGKIDKKINIDYTEDKCKACPNYLKNIVGECCVETASFLENTVYDILIDEEDAKEVKDKKLLAKFEKEVEDDLYYGNMYNKLNGGFAEVKEIAVIERDDGDYRVIADVRHGICDEDGTQSNEGTIDWLYDKNMKFKENLNNY